MVSKYKSRLSVVLCMILFIHQLYSATIFVTNTNDAGAGSFRAVLQGAINGDVIQFNIPGPGPYSIKPLTSYSVSKQVTIDGLSGGKPGVEFDGSLCTNMTCFDFNSAGGSGTVIQGLAINNFVFNANSAAVFITQASGVTIKSCYLGTDITGTIAKPNNNGIFILTSSNNIIGGPSVSDGNIISGNTIRGIWVSGQGGTAANNTTENNKIGIDVNGASLPNFTGVEYQIGASNNLVQHNNISYNLGDGLSFNQNSTGNKIYGNTFSNNGEHGVDFLNSDVTNCVVGVDVLGVGEPNTIFNNGQAGVFISEWYNSGANAYQAGSPSKITVRKNTIYCNGVKGIALTEKTGNLTSAAGNSGKASPVLNLSSDEENTFGTASPGDLIDIYVADACNACYSGNSQGQTWLASVVAAPDGTWAYTKAGGAKCNSLIVTATDALGNTSEFASSCVRPFVDITDTSTCTTINLNLDATQLCATSYQWSTGQTTPAVSLNNMSPGIYWVELKGIDNVAVRDSFEVKQRAVPNTNLGPDIKKCTNPFSPALTLNPGLSTGFIYEWSTAETTPAISVNMQGQYFVKVTDSVTTCSKSDTINISQEVLSVASLKDSSFCNGDSIVLDPGTYVSYQWSDSSTDTSLKVKSAGVYWVVVENSAGCKDSLTATITVNALPGGTLGDTSVCAGGTIVMDAGSYNSYLWDDGKISQSNSISTVGKHWVVVENSSGCKDTIFGHINTGNNLNVLLNDPGLICTDAVVALSATVSGVHTFPLTYNWDGVPGSASQEFSAGDHQVIVTDARNCKGSAMASLVKAAKPYVYLGNDTVVCFKESADFSISLPDTFASVSWMNGLSSGLTFNVSNPDSIIVEVSNGFCKAKDTVVVSEYCDPLKWKFPNWMTPNNDGKNDHFYPLYVDDTDKDKLKQVYFVVYDRWGVEMFENSALAIPEWDGYYKGNVVSSGVYYWIVKWTDVSDNNGEETGWVEVVH